MEKSRRTRRRVLQTIALVGTWGFLAWRFLVPVQESRKKLLLEVKKSDIPSGGALVYRQSRVAVIRRDEEIYALSLVCTHLGCTVNVTPNNLVCPCHGSVFDRNGAVLKGPSDRPLARLEVQEKGDSLMVLG
ncbi:ubiquinol-cytochrome c reductase iron-sulfur subunit [Trichloromonas sp.]|uniref:QcrA and Rieske domain-containing protein n=1 Tax=Trichloromonas sp. TaxID=3069249 RepID=UPI003D813681